MEKFKKIIFGLVLVASAVLILLEALGTINLGFSVTDGILTAFLVMIFFESLVTMQFFGILMAPAIICVIFSDQLGLDAITPWPLICAAALAGFGLNIIFGNKKHGCRDDHERDFEEEKISGEENIINIESSFSAVAKYINVKTVERIDVKMHFGAAKIYLSEADLKNDKAVIDLDVAFSGVELYVPKEWHIKNQVAASLGGVEEKNKPADSNGKTLTIKGKVRLAGVEIIYV